LGEMVSKEKEKRKPSLLDRGRTNVSAGGPRKSRILGRDPIRIKKGSRRGKRP